jgi:hypothetical protein
MNALTTHGLALVACAALGAPAFAQPASADWTSTCTVPREVSTSFKAETDLKDLFTWALGFTCKNLMFQPQIVHRGPLLTIVAPSTMSPDDAFELFGHALAAMNLTVVPKGNMLRIVESATARSETVPAVWRKPARRPHLVITATKPSASEPMTFQLSVKR